MTVIYFRPIWIWFLPTLILLLHTMLSFFAMLRHLGSSEDAKYRKRFDSAYTCSYLFANFSYLLFRSTQSDFVDDLCEIIVERDASYGAVDAEKCHEHALWSGYLF